jgi:hypothetical protein
MTRTIFHTDVDGMINVSFVQDGNDICCMKCDVCGKFISKSHEKFYCPHCHTSFLSWATYEVQKEGDELLEMLKQMGAI